MTASPHFPCPSCLQFAALLCGAVLLALAPGPACAISVGKPSADASPEAELASFQMLDGFEANLFASEKDGVIKPISIRWDERGRLWVITTTSYPQPEPGEECNDKILILEDTQHTGHADKITVFADHLRMPTGLEIAPGPGTAAYVGEGEKLWLMRDTHGDGKADQKQVIFSGFGTGDTHQCINSFTWTPDGALLFSQGLHAYSNVTTAYGGRKLYGAGFWEYRPLIGKLTPYPTGFPLNAWGTVFDDEGQPFTVAGAAGMFWTTPLLVSTEHSIEGRALPNNGQIVKQGMLKYCGVDIPRNSHWPKEMHGELVSGGFFENCIYRHKLQTDKDNPSGYEAVRQPDLMKSSSVAFRPVDVKFGPDGALYVSDWYNPIIGHYQASFRHPDRDKTHGRIWRVVKKGNPLITAVQVELPVSLTEQIAKEAKEAKENPGKGRDLLSATSISDGKGHKMQVVSEIRWYTDLSKASTQELLQVMEKGDRWAQYQAQRLLMGRDKNEVLAMARRHWERGGDFEGFKPGHRWQLRPNALVYLNLLEAFESPEPDLIRFFITALPLKKTETTYSTAAIRAIGLWKDHLEDPLGDLSKIIADENPRVRLEAIAACSHIPKPESIAIALRTLDKPMDSFLDRTLELTVYALAPEWEPALREGKLTLPPKHLAWLLDKKSDGDTLARIRTALHDKPKSFDASSREALLLTLAKRGTSEDVAAALTAGASNAELLSELGNLVEASQIKAPANAVEVLGKLCVENGPVAYRGPAARLVGLWNLSALAENLSFMAWGKVVEENSERQVLIALGRLHAHRDDVLLKFAHNEKTTFTVRLGAVEGLAFHDGKEAAKAALALMPAAKTEEQMRSLLAPFLTKAGKTTALIASLNESPCSKEAADLAAHTLIAMGRNEPELSAVLNKILGRTGIVMPYNAQWVSSLANEATVAGNAKRGDEIFHRAALNCTACHSLGGKGGIIGPQLDGLGHGMPAELIVESVMWPQRQIKEGYAATTVTMKDGRSLVGYKTNESATALTLRDLASNTTSILPKADIQSRTDGGSLMPDGLTASLSREELRDLIAFLASLGR